MDTAPNGFKPPYLSFQTFWSFLADLSAKPLPPKLDRSIMSSKSGTDQLNLIGALGGFGLIGDDGTVQPALERFAEAPVEQRKEVLARLVKDYYAAPLAVSAQNGTPADLTNVFRDELGMTASDTRRKAITFFLHAAREAELPLSPHFPKTRAGSGAPGAPKTKRTTTRRKPANESDSDSTSGSSGTGPQGHSQTVTLKSGGTVTLTYDVNMFQVTDDDEAFVLGLIKKLRTYPAASPTTNGVVEESS